MSGFVVIGVGVICVGRFDRCRCDSCDRCRCDRCGRFDRCRCDRCWRFVGVNAVVSAVS